MCVCVCVCVRACVRVCEPKSHVSNVNNSIRPEKQLSGSARARKFRMTSWPMLLLVNKLKSGAKLVVKMVDRNDNQVPFSKYHLKNTQLKLLTLSSRVVIDLSKRIKATYLSRQALTRTPWHTCYITHVRRLSTYLSLFDAYLSAFSRSANGLQPIKLFSYISRRYTIKYTYPE